MQVFVSVARFKSFTAAADRLNCSKTYVSRAVARLELHLKATLIERTTRQLYLSEVGEKYLPYCEEIISSLEEAEASLKWENQSLRGKLSLYAPTGFGQSCVVPMVAKFQKKNPDVVVNLALGRLLPDLLSDGIDVAFVLSQQSPITDLSSEFVGRTYSIACAAERYLRLYGTPASPADLTVHRCLRAHQPNVISSDWTFNNSGRSTLVRLKRESFDVSDEGAIAVAAMEGMGIASLPIYVAQTAIRRGDLVRVLPEFDTGMVNIYAIYSDRNKITLKVRAWIDHIKEYLAKEDWYATVRNKNGENWVNDSDDD
jgi:DNA-binding transcriptional LysR family regulator